MATFNGSVLETLYPIGPLFLTNQTEVDPRIRERNVHWLIATCNLLQFSPETLFLAVHLTDRYLERQMELLWAVALRVAVEHKELVHEVCFRSYLASLQGIEGRTEQELCAMEEDIYRAIGWSQDLASRLDFLRRNCKATMV
ncbi:uncharacterized protein LOC144123922 [Amblyomma americanum]